MSERLIKQAAVGLGVADGEVDGVLVAQRTLGRKRAVEHEVARRRIAKDNRQLKLELVLRQCARLVRAQHRHARELLDG